MRNLQDTPAAPDPHHAAPAAGRWRRRLWQILAATTVTAAVLLAAVWARSGTYTPATPAECEALRQAADRATDVVYEDEMKRRGCDNHTPERLKPTP